MRFQCDERNPWQHVRCWSLRFQNARCAAQSLNFPATPGTEGEMESEEAG